MYISEAQGIKKAVLFFADVYGLWYLNNQLYLAFLPFGTLLFCVHHGPLCRAPAHEHGRTATEVPKFKDIVRAWADMDGLLH